MTNANADMQRIIAFLPMFDHDQPDVAGSLAGESFAAIVECYPGRLRPASVARLNGIVARYLDRTSGILSDLGFDRRGVRTYRAAAIEAFSGAIERCRA